MRAVWKALDVPSEIVDGAREVAQLGTTNPATVQDPLQQPGVRALRERCAEVGFGAGAGAASLELGAYDLELCGATAVVERQKLQIGERLVRAAEQQESIDASESRLMAEEPAWIARQVGIERREGSESVVVAA